MTREEELDWLYRLRSEIYVYMPKEWLIPMSDALDMAIKALSTDYAVGVDSTGRFVKASEVFCDRNICIANEYNGIGCDECEVTKSQEPKWIPVSEPPKELGTYLIQTDGEPYMCQCRWTDVNPFWTDYKTKPHWNIFDLPQYSKVVAWMPLPKPYKPQERSEDAT